MIQFALDTTGQTLILSDTVLTHFWRFRQSVSTSREAGGQLFARFEGDITVVERATGPRRSDRRTPFSFIPNRLAERREIRRFFKEGLHYVGDWHTHLEAHPHPSATDERSINETFRKSHHQLTSFVLVIVGTSQGPNSLFVGVSDGKRLRPLIPDQSDEPVGAL